MKYTAMILTTVLLLSCGNPSSGLPDSYQQVDQVLWVVSDLRRTMDNYQQLGFEQMTDLGTVQMRSRENREQGTVKLAVANLGGAHINWIEPVQQVPVLSEFLEQHGEGAVALVHRFPDRKAVHREVRRLKALGVGILDEITIETEVEEIPYILMNTAPEGKYILGFTWGEKSMNMFASLGTGNRHAMKLNQYAFAIRDPEPVSAFWASLGLPELEIRHPELGHPMYYGEPADHDLIQGWQRHGTISYEWCIPVKPPIVYEDHIRLHGEGIHHLAFTVQEMDPVLEDFRSRGYVISMGGTWGETGKPGSGRYEYVDLEKAGGVTMELLWNYSEQK